MTASHHFKGLQVVIDKQKRKELLIEYYRPTIEKSELEAESLQIHTEWRIARDEFLECLQSITNDTERDTLKKKYQERESAQLSLMSSINTALIRHEIQKMQQFLNDLLIIATQELYDIVNENDNLPEVLKLLLVKKNRLNKHKLKNSTSLIGRENTFQFDLDAVELYESKLDEQISYVREMISVTRLNKDNQNFKTHSESQDHQYENRRHYVAQSRIDELNQLKSNSDVTRLIQLCLELNHAFSGEAFFSIAALQRSIINYVPPIFGYDSFAQVIANYGFGKSIKASLDRLQNGMKDISDNHLHSQASAVDALPNHVQIHFSNELDVLLGEVCKALKIKERN